MVKRFDIIQKMLLKYSLRKFYGKQKEAADWIGVTPKTITNWKRQFRMEEYREKCIESKYTTDSDFWGNEDCPVLVINNLFKDGNNG